MSRLSDRIMLMVAKAVVRLVNDSGQHQLLQLALLHGETRDDATRIQNYGVSSHPPAGSAAVAIFPGGNRDHPIVIAVEDRNARPRGLKRGEVIVYDDKGQSIRLTRDGIVINGGGKPVTITNTPKVRAETDLLEVTGDIRDRCDGDGRTMDGMRSVYNGHRHPGDSGGTTGTPSDGM